MIHLTLPYPPSVNNYWRMSHGRFYIDQKGVDFRNAVQSIVLQARANNKVRGRLKAEIFAIMPDRRVRDLDNLNKAILDSLTYSQVIEDDKHIDDLRIVRAGYEKNNGRIEIYISELIEGEQC
ncbi:MULTISPECIES: RusA family crossover junction endodeoxyribonuclease [unclassified Gilliamella]|uniref:RusA family crossover junction endodeoxyribonuclease n=1 Tax=unclassified Gilliamella TaxID=2685620 RepID=UPI00226A993E|nr:MULTISPECIES: RusA family crossover junction endodeoxyribonuclease [unclassified Gilliamella]MCX8597590.1 RusA family crossover junction endodeoxyribonuclease [Gilliamella sp. B3493]MCX8599091.1 RusA family crossover junction endodeoxyribonuclease [Gilliamella sp. B3486]MCX8656528.1 RusA family crossover junction endodeoxyribonuclease [Gilliamella sp. B2894]MCX8688899.1 RusA family crossover junction endodeoxyribonuclease [Gilliamella sp. B2973]MCX8693161.1 RusA family crossover junction en